MQSNFNSLEPLEVYWKLAVSTLKGMRSSLSRTHDISDLLPEPLYPIALAKAAKQTNLITKLKDVSHITISSSIVKLQGKQCCCEPK